jgi:hypothetical protein
MLNPVLIREAQAPSEHKVFVQRNTKIHFPITREVDFGLLFFTKQAFNQIRLGEFALRVYRAHSINFLLKIILDQPF